MEEIKILLLCSSRFAFPAMQNFVHNNLLGAVVIPEYCHELLEQTEGALLETGIPVLSVKKDEVEKTLLKAINEYKLNTGFVFTFSYIIPQEVYAIMKNGFYNVHPGPLPEYRGADPMFYQIKNREKFAAVSIHHLDSGADTGAIVLQEKIRLHPYDTYGMLAHKLAQLSVKLADTIIRILAMGFAIPSKPQDETKAHYYKTQEIHELTIDWDIMDADEIVALINACNPHNKGAATMLNNKLIRLLVAERLDDDEKKAHVAGTIVKIDDERMEVVTVNNQLLSISFLYIDEGYITPSYLRQSGVMVNMVLEKVFKN